MFVVQRCLIVSAVPCIFRYVPLGYQKAQLTKAANRLRKKIAEVEQANLVMESPTFEPGKDYELVKNHIRFLSNLFSLISRAASSLRSQREKAEEFARQNPEEHGEFSLLQEILAHWDSSEMDDLLDEADTLLDRLGNEIKLLPNADMLYDRHVSSIAYMPKSPTPTCHRLLLTPFNLLSPPSSSRKMRMSSVLPIRQSRIVHLIPYQSRLLFTPPGATLRSQHRSRMKGKAAEIIADFEPSEEDYAEAVRIIESTYSRPELLRNHLWEKLKQQARARNSATFQRTILCSIRATWAQMKRLNEESRSSAVLKTIRSKFPRHTCEKVGELKKKGDPMWTVDELLVALDEVIDQQETIEDTVPEYYSTCNSDSAVRQGSLSPRRYPTKQPSRSSYDQSSCATCSRSLRSPPGYHSVRSRSPTPYYSRRSSRSPTLPPQHQEYRCVFCEREGHRPENCFEVRSVKQRRAIVNESGLYWLCLKQGHECILFSTYVRILWQSSPSCPLL
ncbi:unnamed protein product [Cylicocyclus nassatus]|uniref:Uncharacterized protein n=1 Tax=Cylicocyclus nassatus TaxID=53992 RepID=A0AA36M8D9_CYLNA|nr:unnamed protein product [Cylicocyclus nassatus]